jgi:hypothetical protein
MNTTNSDAEYAGHKPYFPYNLLIAAWQGIGARVNR